MSPDDLLAACTERRRAIEDQGDHTFRDLICRVVVLMSLLVACTTGGILLLTTSGVLVLALGVLELILWVATALWTMTIMETDHRRRLLYLALEDESRARQLVEEARDQERRGDR